MRFQILCMDSIPSHRASHSTQPPGWALIAARASSLAHGLPLTRLLLQPPHLSPSPSAGWGSLPPATAPLLGDTTNLEPDLLLLVLSDLLRRRAPPPILAVAPSDGCAQRLIGASMLPCVMLPATTPSVVFTRWMGTAVQPLGPLWAELP